MNSAFAPYSYEVMHTKEGTHYRVRDAGDNRVATCYLEENAQAIVAALNANRPEVGSWVLVDGFDGVLKHCGSRDALKAELDHGAFPGIFCLKEGRFYAYRLPQHLPQSSEDK